MQLNSVVLPAPFGPIRPQIAPGATLNVTSSRAVTPPKRIETPSTDKQRRSATVGFSGLGSRLGQLHGLSVPVESPVSRRPLPINIDVYGRIVTCFVAGNGANGETCLWLLPVTARFLAFRPPSQSSGWLARSASTAGARRARVPRATAAGVAAPVARTDEPERT